VNQYSEDIKMLRDSSMLQELQLVDQLEVGVPFLSEGERSSNGSEGLGIQVALGG